MDTSIRVEGRSTDLGSRPEPLLKPRWRGVSHQVAFFVSLPLGLGLVLASGVSPPVTVYALLISALFGVSALFHRKNWAPKARLRMRRLDHSMIFLAIAGTYTAVASQALDGTARAAVLVVVWAGAAMGIVTKFLWIGAPKWVSGVTYVVLGWVAVAVVPQLVDAVGLAGLALLAGGGILYTIGAVIYASRRPDPVPLVFGYHEVFHALVIGGALAHFVLVATMAVPNGTN